MRLSHDNNLLQQLLAPMQRTRERPKGTSPKAKAAAYRVEALKALRHWGHLRCGDLAALLWPRARYGEQMAQRLMHRLESERGEVASRLNAIGTRSYVLTRRGAAALDVLNIAARHGLELCSVAGATFIHRAVGTAFGIAAAAHGFDVYGEHAIAQGIAPVSRDALATRFKKLPDLLLVRGDKATWVEVEASAKPMQELQACVRMASFVGQPLVSGSSLMLGALSFVFDATQGHAQRIARAARLQWSDVPKAQRDVLARRITLVHAELGPMLRWHGMRESALVL